MRIIRITAVVAVLLPGPALAMEPGEWQMTTTLSSPMFPKPQTVSHTECIRKGEGDDPIRLIGQQPAGCKVTLKQKSASGYAWDMECPKDGMRASGSVSFTRDTMQGEIKMQRESGGQTFDMLTKMSGKWLGPCK